MKGIDKSPVTLIDYDSSTRYKKVVTMTSNHKLAFVAHNIDTFIHSSSMPSRTSSKISLTQPIGHRSRTDQPHDEGGYINEASQQEVNKHARCGHRQKKCQVVIPAELRKRFVLIQEAGFSWWHSRGGISEPLFSARSGGHLKNGITNDSKHVWRGTG